MLAKLAFANVRKSAKDFAVYFFTLVLGIAVFYAFNSVAGSDAVARISEDTRQMVELLGVIISGVSLFIAVILAFLVIYANRFLIKRRNKEFALYLTLGMRKSDLFKVSALETCIVGALSLVVGLVLGIGISQVLSNVAASMFDTAVEGVAFSISAETLVYTVAVFAVIFFVTVALNTGYLFKAKLIDLLHGDRKNEVLTLRSLPLSFVLFGVSCVIIGVSYKLLMDNGLMNVNEQFIGATVLVCVGTVLFFYSLSGFLLRLFQTIRPLYLRGLNMFFLRQLSARVNSAFVSMSVISLTLFLAITSVCGGIGICNVMASGVESGTKYDASVITDYMTPDPESGEMVSIVPEGFDAFVEEHDRDMASGLADSAAALGAASWDDLVDRSVQVDFYMSGITYGDVRQASGESIFDHVGAGIMLAGLEPVVLGEDETLIWSDFTTTVPYFEAVASKQPVLSYEGRDLRVRSEISRDTLETTGVAQRAGVLVVPDSCIPSDAIPYSSLLDVQCKPGQAEAFGAFMDEVENTPDTNTWPVTMVQTASDVRTQSKGLVAVVSYLAMYIGFVLVTACAAILAIQQLTDASNNVRRYELLAKLGAPESMISGALFKQIGIYFLFPLVLGVAHTLCAMQVVIDVVRVFGYMDIGQMSVIAVAAFLAVYGAYFLVTYFTARAMVRFRRS